MGKPRDLANVVATGNILADGAVAPAELTGVNATAAELNILDGVTATAAELNILDGVTANTAELNHVDGVTSNVQTQMDTKAPVASPTFTGTATAPTINASTALQIGGVAITATAAELNIMDGVTASASDINGVAGINSNVQTQLNLKAPIDGATFTGTTTIPTADINGGAIDGAIIGANSAAAVTATTLNASTKLQVNGTDVITNARALSNITSIDATTAAAIGAGGVGGGGEIELTALGAITAGDPVGITTSGSVSKLAALAVKKDISATTDPMNTGNNSKDINVIYIGSNKVLFFWREETNNYKAQIGTLSGSSLSLGTLYTVNDDTSSSTPAYGKVVYASNTGQVIFFWKYGGSNGDKGYAKAATISGTSLTFGSEVNIGSNDTVYYNEMAWDASAQRAVLVYRSGAVGNGDKLAYSLVSVSGTTLTVQQDAQMIGSNLSVYLGARIIYDSTAQKTILFWPDPTNNYMSIVCMDVGSSSVTFGTIVNRPTSRYFTDANMDATFVPGVNKVGYCYDVYSGTEANTLRIGILSLSGTTITVNEQELLDHANVNDYVGIRMSADNNGKVLITYDDNDSSNPDKLRAIIGAYSGTTFTSTLADFTIISNLVYAGPFSQCFTDSTNDKFVHFGHQNTGQGGITTQGYVAHVIGGVDDLTAFNNWIGLSSQSVSNGASVKVTVQSGLNENQSNLSVGAKYYIQDDGTVGTTLIENRQIGVATAATKLFLTNGTIEIGPTGYNSN